MLQRLKSWMLPIALLAGSIGYRFFSLLMPLAPYLLFTMLFITFCRVSPRDLRVTGLHVKLMIVQCLLGLVVYVALLPCGPAVAQGVMLCVMAPTATSAPVVTGMLGGSAAFLASFAMLSNLTATLTTPAIFAWIGVHGDMTFVASFLLVCGQVLPVLLLPLCAAWGLKAVLPAAHAWVSARQSITFYLWSLALTVVTGNTVKFVLEQKNPDHTVEISLAMGALVVCLAQFFVGKWLGGLHGDRISGGQALGQKNTILAIWVALLYAPPPASLAPAAYAVWQNLFNAWQLWRKQRLAVRQEAKQV